MVTFYRCSGMLPVLILIPLHCVINNLHMAPRSIFQNGCIENFHFVFQQSDWLAFARLKKSMQFSPLEVNKAEILSLLSITHSILVQMLWPITSLESKVEIFYATIPKYATLY